MEDYSNLINSGYFGNPDLSEHLAQRVAEEMEAGNISREDLVGKACSSMGICAAGVGRMITQIKKGHAERFLPFPYKYRQLSKTGRRQLEKIAILLHSLDLPMDDPLIQRLKRTYLGFRYPPKYEDP